MAIEREDSVSVQLAEVRWRLAAIDEWRHNIDGRVSVMESKVSDLRFSDAVAEALAQKFDASRRFRFTIWQKLGGGTFAVVLVVLPVLIEKYA